MGSWSCEEQGESLRTQRKTPQARVAERSRSKIGRTRETRQRRLPTPDRRRPVVDAAVDARQRMSRVHLVAFPHCITLITRWHEHPHHDNECARSLQIEAAFNPFVSRDAVGNMTTMQRSAVPPQNKTPATSDCYDVLAVCAGRQKAVKRFGLH